MKKVGEEITALDEQIREKGSLLNDILLRLPNYPHRSVPRGMDDKDNVEVRTFTPNTDKVDLTWTDPAPTAGQTSYYYVRGEQSDAEKQLVWVSPMWIKFEPKK